MGVLTATIATVYGAIIIFRTLVHGADVPGYPSIMVLTLFLGGVQLIFLGVIAEYLGRLFNEAKRRPCRRVEACRGHDARRSAGFGSNVGTSAPSGAVVSEFVRHCALGSHRPRLAGTAVSPSDTIMP